MSRSKSIASRKHRKIKKAAKGFRNANRKRVRNAKETLLHAGKYAYIGRKQKKRNFRKLWITRLNAAVREHDLSYSAFINLLNKSEIGLDRKILSDIAITDPKTFKTIVEKTKSFSKKN